MKMNPSKWSQVFRSPSEYFDGTVFRDGEDIIIAVKDGLIDYIGPQTSGMDFPQSEVIECGGKTLTPGLIDCHTHLVFGGDRSHEFSLRASGSSYEALQAQGGGIHYTVAETRISSASELELAARLRLDVMLRHGVTTVEIKSGYGLDVENEIKMLQVIQRLQDHPIDCVPTCLAAHVVPKTYAQRKDAYLALVINELLPQVAERDLCEFVDIFIEHNAFSIDDGRKLFKAAQRLNLGIKLHAEQLSYQGSAELAAEFGAASADHLEYVSKHGMKVLAKAQTTAVLLPTCNLFLQQDAKAPARALLDAGCTVALSTDCNPGSSMVENLLLVMSLGMTQLGMTATEVWRAVTVGGAAAISRKDRGQLTQGMVADLVLYDCKRGVEVPYRMGSMEADSVYKGGRCVFRARS